MLPSLFNHLLQSTLFAALAGLLTLAFRKNRAQVRYSLWLAASVKFLIPFSILIAAGSHFAWRAPSVVVQSGLSFVVEQMSEPPVTVSIAPAVSHLSTTDCIPSVLFGLWVIGFLIVVTSWWRRWRSLRTVLRVATPLQLESGIEALTSYGFGEPGVYGILRPVLLLPTGIADELTPLQLDAILAHELCHVRRRDNLATAIHMIVEAVFWFHPLVWWLGARLMDERERACDEEVLRGGSAPQAYAEGILRICELYLESPLQCVAGVTGANLKQRIEEIMSHRAVRKLNAAKKVALLAAGTFTLALPILIGAMNASVVRAQVASGLPTARFEVASIKACKSDTVPGIRIGGGVSPGRLTLTCQPLMSVIRQAYFFFANGRFDPPGLMPPIEGGPGWIDTDLYTIEAKPEGAPGEGVMRGPMTQALLEDRFKLKMHRETREVPIYALTVEKGGAKLTTAAPASCVPSDIDHAVAPLAPGETRLPICRIVGIARDALNLYGASMTDLATALASRRLGRDVIDRTGLAGAYEFHLQFAPGSGVALPPAPPPQPGADPAAAPAPADPADIFLAIQSQLEKIGLRLESAKGPGEFLVIDHVERPSEN